MCFVLFSFTLKPNCDEMFFSFSKVSVNVCLVLAVISISSAYAEHCFKRVDMLPLSFSCFKILSITVINRVANSGSPCFTPVNISKFCV